MNLLFFGVVLQVPECRDFFYTPSAPRLEMLHVNFMELVFLVKLVIEQSARGATPSVCEQMDDAVHYDYPLNLKLTRFHKTNPVFIMSQTLRARIRVHV